MPRRLAPADRRMLLAAGLLLAVLALITALLAPSQADRSDQPTTYSSGSKGAKAVWLLLRESGYRVERWERPLRHLRATRATLVLSEPSRMPAAEDVERLHQFVAGGGRVIVSGAFAGGIVPGARVVPRPWAIVWRPVRAAAPAGPTRAAPAITIVPQAAWNPQAPATTLYADDGVAVVTRFTVGRGEVLWWAAATPLTNAGLREPGNLEFVLACLGRPEDGPILFDEYLHGHGGTQAEGVRASSPFGWLLLQGLVLGTAVVLTFSRRSGPVLAAIADTRLSPLEFVQTLGGLYQRAGAASVAVDVCHQRFRYWVSRRLGTPFNLGTEELERVLRERRLFEDPEFRSTLADCEEARKKPRLRPRDALPLVRALYRYAAALHLFDRPGAARRPGRS